MLAELAIANAAFSVIKETINNGGDILSAGQHLFQYFDAKFFELITPIATFIVGSLGTLLAMNKKPTKESQE